MPDSQDDHNSGLAALDGEDHTVAADPQPTVLAPDQRRVTCLASEAGSRAYCSILATIRSRSRGARRRMSRIALVAHSMVVSRASFTSLIADSDVKGLAKARRRLTSSIRW